MKFFEAVNSRYSYRGQFEQKPLPREDVEKILTAALAAPTGMHIQTSSYVVVEDPDTLTELSKVLHRYGAAPMVLVMLSEDGGTRYNFEIENYSAATQNVLLAVTALGYATVWTDGTLRNPEVNDAVRTLLHIPEGKTIRAVLPIGVPVQPQGPVPKDAIADRVTFL